MKIVVLDGHSLNPGDLNWDKLEQAGDLIVYERTKNEEITERIDGAEIVFTNKTPITKETIGVNTSVKYIGVLATGYNLIDVQAAKEQGIVVTNIPTYSTAAVAQFAIAHILNISNHVEDHAHAVRAGEWTSQKDFTFWKHPLIELLGKTFGAIGFGNIGRATAKIAESLGMKVIAYNPIAVADIGETEMVELEEIYKRSDVISLHCPLTPETEGMINKESLSQMKSTAMLINTARGGLVVEQDLADALNNGRIYSAGLDVVSEEPIKKDNPLLTAKNCYITPHIAWAPKETRARLLDIAVDNLKKFLEGNPQNAL